MKIQDFKVSQSDFIAEKKGRFRDFYSFGPVLGTGNIFIVFMNLSNRRFWRSQKMFEQEVGFNKSSQNYQERHT